MSNPQYTIKNIIDAITVNKDDGATPAVISFQYSNPPEGLKYLFDNYDIIVTVGKPMVTPSRHIQNKPTFYPGTYPVHVFTLDKYAAGVLVCTGTNIMWKMRKAMRTIIEANAIVGAYTLRIKTEKSSDRRIAGLFVYETVFTLEYKET